MKRILHILIVILVAYSCGSNGGLKKSKGELVGLKGIKYYPEKPFGMVLVPGGSYIMGKSDDDMPQIQDAPTKTVTVRSFYMDETEITNAEYRQFVRWVRDSVIRYQLATLVENVELEGGEEHPMYKYKFKNEKDRLAKEDGTADDPVYNYFETEDVNVLDWEQELVGIGPTYNNPKGNYDKNLWPDELYTQAMEEFLLKKDEIFNDMQFAWKVNKFKYENKYSNLSGPNGYLARMEEHRRLELEQLYNEDGNLMPGIEDITQAGGFPTFRFLAPIEREDPITGEIKTAYTDDLSQVDDNEITIDTIEISDEYIHEAYPVTQRKNYIKEIPVRIYPDTTVWIKDFKYSYNTPMHNDYFWHDAYSDYPVVGVTWHQAKAFCEWRTKTKNKYQKTKKKKSLVPEFRLPTEAEWEYAARGGLQSAMYPWGGPYTKDDKGCFLANFKPMRGDYAVDQALYTVEADSYEPNGYNLYNMAGNVSEWIDSSYEPEAYEFSSTMNPNVNDVENELKVVRGGSWKDVKYFLQVSSRDYENADQARSYIGFRTVHDYLGADMTANQMVNNTNRKRNNKKSSLK